MDRSDAATRTSFARRMAESGLNPSRYVRVLQADGRAPLLQVAKTAGAATIAWALCLFLLPGQFPVFGAIAAVIVIQPSVNQSFSRALERTVGVIVGVLIAYLSGAIFGSSSWVVLCAIVLAIFTAWMLRLSQTTTVQLPISAMLVLSVGAQTPGYAFDRIVETAIGAAVAVLVNLAIVPPVRLQPAHDAVTALGRETAASLEKLAGFLMAPSTVEERNAALVEVRLLAPMATKAFSAITSAEESLRFNPRRRSHSSMLDTDSDLLAMLQIIVTRLPGMVRGLVDNYDPSLPTEPTARGVAEEMSKAAHDLRLVLQGAGHPVWGTAKPEIDEPTLTEPLRILMPSVKHWVLIGSLIEDLRRLHEVIVDARQTVGR